MLNIMPATSEPTPLFNAGVDSSGRSSDDSFDPIIQHHAPVTNARTGNYEVLQDSSSIDRSNSNDLEDFQPPHKTEEAKKEEPLQDVAIANLFSFPSRFMQRATTVRCGGFLFVCQYTTPTISPPPRLCLTPNSRASPVSRNRAVSSLSSRETSPPSDDKEPDSINSASLREMYRSVPVPEGGSWWSKMRAFMGPGILVAVGYMDPGNWATVRLLCCLLGPCMCPWTPATGPLVA